MKFFNSEKNHFFETKCTRKLIKAISKLILIIISIEFRVSISKLFSMFKIVFSEKWSFLKNYMGFKMI